mgnify:CR=1 FL=1
MKKAIKHFTKLNSYIAGNRKYLVLVIISALLANIFMLVAPYISGRAIDFIKGENNVDFPMVAKFYRNTFCGLCA